MFRRIVRLPLWLSCLSLSFALLIGGVAGSFIDNQKVLAHSTAAETPTLTAERSTASGTSGSDRANGPFQASFAPVIQKVTPSVVNIFSSRNIRSDRNLEPFFNDPFFRRFFGDDFWARPAIPRERQERSLGSRVIVSPDGYILTDEHLVDGATEVKVSLSDKREFTARVVGKDGKADLAMLKIDQSGLPAVNFGDSTIVQVGDVVFAIGNPFGVRQTVTMGLVSAMGRGGLGIEEYEDFIQDRCRDQSG
jgi:serine protease Do